MRLLGLTTPFVIGQLFPRVRVPQRFEPRLCPWPKALQQSSNNLIRAAVARCWQFPLFSEIFSIWLASLRPGPNKAPANWAPGLIIAATICPISSLRPGLLANSSTVSLESVAPSVVPPLIWSGSISLAHLAISFESATMSSPPQTSVEGPSKSGSSEVTPTFLSATRPSLFRTPSAEIFFFFIARRSLLAVTPSSLDASTTRMSLTPLRRAPRSSISISLTRLLIT